MNIVLYQIIPELDAEHLMFNSYEYIKESCGDKFPAEIYEVVFSGKVAEENCEDVFRIFNTKFPTEYKGRSMSVSDVIEVISGLNNSEFWFCDNMGFKKVEFEKAKAMTLVLNHNFDCVQEKRENVSIFFIGNSGLMRVKCKKFELTRCKYSETQIGYRIICKRMDGMELKYDFLERPSIIVSECREDFPRELLYIDEKRTRYTVHDKGNLGIVCTWLIRKGYVFEYF